MRRRRADLELPARVCRASALRIKILRLWMPNRARAGIMILYRADGGRAGRRSPSLLNISTTLDRIDVAAVERWSVAICLHNQQASNRNCNKTNRRPDT